MSVKTKIKANISIVNANIQKCMQSVVHNYSDVFCTFVVLSSIYDDYDQNKSSINASLKL